MEKRKEKRTALQEKIKALERVAIAYSGGVDSTLLLKISSDILGKTKTLAIILKTELLSGYDFQEALLLLKQLGCRYMTIEKPVLEIEEISRNSTDRCYHCKKEGFSTIISKARARGFNDIIDGTNYDDLTNSFRPGVRALEELGIISPFAQSGITKSEIRAWAKELKLNCWDKPSSSCLATRIPYNEQLTIDRIKLVENAENILRSMSFSHFRVRIHGNIARIELSGKDLGKILSSKSRKSLAEKLKTLGFKFITLDIDGYRSGGMDI